MKRAERGTFDDVFYHLPRIKSALIPTSKHFRSRQDGQNRLVCNVMMQLPLNRQDERCSKEKKLFLKELVSNIIITTIVKLKVSAFVSLISLGKPKCSFHDLAWPDPDFI